MPKEASLIKIVKPPCKLRIQTDSDVWENLKEKKIITSIKSEDESRKSNVSNPEVKENQLKG